MSAGTVSAVTATAPPPPPSSVLPDVASVAFWLKTIAATGGHPNDQLFEYIAPTNRPRLEHRLKRLRKLRALKFSGAKKRGKHSRLVGLAYEQLIRGILDGSQALRYMHNVRSTTSEIDFLLQVEPFGVLCPILNYAKSHVLGEAKCHSCGIKSDWITELQGLLIAHNTKVAILFVGCKPQKVPSAVRQAIALFSVTGYHIIPIGEAQLEEVLKGANFLRVLSDQYMRVLAHGALDV